jgi:hypothetical protein
VLEKRTTGRVQQPRPKPRMPYQARSDPTVVRRYQCPRYSGDHTSAECQAQVAALDAVTLTNLRQRVLEELGAALLAGAPRDHIDAVVVVLRGIEARISREQDAPTPTRQRRARIAVESHPGGSPGSGLASRP